MPSNVRQLLENGVPVYPITDSSLVIGLGEGAIMKSIYAWDGTSTPVVANIPAGVVVNYNDTDYTGTLAASGSTSGYIYLVYNSTSGEYDRYGTDATGGSYAWKPMGDTTIQSPDIADNLTTNDSTKALSAKQGKVLNDNLGQLDQKLKYPSTQPSVVSGYINTNQSTIDGVRSTSGSVSSAWFPVTPGQKIIIYGTAGNSAYYRLYAFVDAQGDKGDTFSGYGDYTVTPMVVTVPLGAANMAVNFKDYNSATDKVLVEGGDIDIAGEAQKVDEMYPSFLILNDKTAAKFPKRGVNLVVSNNISVGKYAKADGTFGSGGGWCTIRVDFVRGGIPIYIHDIYSGYYCIMDKNGTVLAGKNTSERDLFSGYILPENAAYGYFSSEYGTVENVLANCAIAYCHELMYDERDNRAGYVDSFTFQPPTVVPTEYEGRDFGTFRKIVCCGDSLTMGVFNYTIIPGQSFDFHGGVYSYPAQLAAISGREVINLGNSGDTSDSWYEHYKDDERLSGVDCAIIELGVNDSLETLNTVSKQAFINIVNKLKANNEGIKIFICGIINAKSYKCSWNTETYYTKDQFIRSLYAEEWASDPDVYLLDLARYGHLLDLYSTNTLDNYNSGHLSAYGYNRLAQDIHNYIGYIMRNNPTSFRNIQFIGSDYEYNPV